MTEIKPEWMETALREAEPIFHAMAERLRRDESVSGFNAIDALDRLIDRIEQGGQP